MRRLGANDGVGLMGRITVRLHDRTTGRVVREMRTSNLVVNGGLNALKSVVENGASGWADGLTFIALGTGVTPPANGDAALETEYCRTQYYIRTWVGDTFTVSAFFVAASADIDIKEAGIFGNGASIVPGSGTLFARVAVTGADNSTGAFDVSVDWEITITRG